LEYSQQSLAVGNQIAIVAAARMNTTLASVLPGAWFVALMGAIWTDTRKSREGIVRGREMGLGSLLLFGLVSGVIGLYEMSDHVQSLPFWNSITIGLIGLILIHLGSQGALKPLADQTRQEAI
jgi:hypothetical protein